MEYPWFNTTVMILMSAFEHCSIYMYFSQLSRPMELNMPLEMTYVLPPYGHKWILVNAKHSTKNIALTLSNFYKYNDGKYWISLLITAVSATTQQKTIIWFLHMCWVNLHAYICRSAQPVRVAVHDTLRPRHYLTTRTCRAAFLWQHSVRIFIIYKHGAGIRRGQIRNARMFRISATSEILEKQL
jgi:hypothetical protein